MRRNKFNAKPTVCAQGHKHASKKESGWCNTLHIKYAAGEIEDLSLEPQFWFEIGGKPLKHRNGHRAGFKPDFTYFDIASQSRVCLEVKGMSVRDFPLRIALARALWPDIDWIVV